MTSKKSAKRELLSSVMALLICIAMFSGTTYAWFTDSVTSGVNRIVAGNLDVKLYHSNKTVTDEEVDASTLLFTDIDLWEPGAMVYENFTVENAGSLALKYVFNLKVTNATVVNGRSLADVLKVAVVDGGVADDRPTALSEDFSPINSFSLNGSLESDGTDTFGIIVYWQPGENDNDYNVAGEVFEISIGVDLFATQMISESDSFDNTYDAGAQLPITLIAPITVSGNTLAAPVTLGASSASAVSAENPVHVSVPSGAKVEENTTDFIVTVQQTNAEVPVNPASTAVAFDINMPLASDNTAIVPVTMHIGPGLNLVAVYHDGVEMTEAATGAADTYQYDPVSGIITLYITHCSEFAFVYGADFAVSNFEEFLAALDDAEDGDVIGLTANINPAYDFEFTKSVVVVIDMRSFGFTRAREADGGYKIAIDPDCNLTMMNGGWDIDAAFGDISTKGSNGTCVVNFKNVVFTDLKPGNPGSPLTNAFHGNMWGNMTVNVTFENCTFNNVGIEFSGSHSEVESDNTYIAEFIGCTFNSTVGNFLYVIDADNYCMTDDCEVTVTNCTFNIISTGNALIFDNIFSSPTVKLNFTNNTVNGFRYDPNDLSAYVKVCLPGTNFDVTASGNTFTGIASFN
jgi:predicted ribosomally synthesized peptide with SipW-like signal peptide